MEFSVELASPIGQHAPVLGLFPHTVVKFGETTSHLNQRKLASHIVSFTNGSCSSELLHHGWSGSATSITVSEKVQGLGYRCQWLSRGSEHGRRDIQVTSRFLLLVIPFRISSMLALYFSTDATSVDLLCAVGVDGGHVGQNLTRV